MKCWNLPDAFSANRRTAFFASWAFAGFGGRDCVLWHLRERKRHQIPGFWRSGFVKPQVAGTRRGNLVRGQKAKTPNSRIPENCHNKTPGHSWAKRDFGAQQPPKGPPKGPKQPTREETPRTARAQGGFRKSKQYDYLDTEVPTERRSWQASMTRSAMPCSAFFM